MEDLPQTEQVASKSRWKKLKRIILVLAALFLLVLVSGFVLANIYEKEIKKYAIDEVNTYLKAKLKIEEDDVSFSFFKKFPNASLNFSNLLIEEENSKDTLLFAENFSLEFGLGSLFSGNYEVKEIDLDDAHLNLIVDNKGEENYIFWKKSEQTDSTEASLTFSLKEVNFNRVEINYTNEQTKNLAQFTLNSAQFAGDFALDSSVLSIQSDLWISSIQNDSTVYFNEKSSLLSVEKAVFDKDNVRLEKGSLKVGEMSLDLNAIFNLNKQKNTISAVAKNVEISEVFSLMPNEVSEKLKAYKTDGFVNGNIEIKTNKKETIPRIKADFHIEKGTVTESNSGVKLQDLALDGNYELSPFTQKIELTKGKGRLSGGEFELNGKLLGTTIQTILTNIKGNFKLDELAQFLNVASIENMGGTLNLNNEFRGSYRDGNLSVSEFLGTAKLNEASLKLKNNKTSYTNFNGNITFNRFKSNASLTGNYGNSDLSISSQFSNFIPYLFNNQTLDANIYVQSKFLELDELLGNEKAEVEQGMDTSGVKIPNDITATLRVSVEKLTYQKHELEQVSGSLAMNGNGIRTNDLLFVSNKGKINLKGSLTANNQGFELKSDIVLGQIDISDLLLRFNNFEQNVVRSEHLTGRANAIISIQSTLNEHLELDLNSLIVNTEYSISEGELKNLELFEEIGDYLKSNVISKNIVKVDELSKRLKLVKFSEFSNTLEIRDRMIHIPSMIIKTSAMDIGLYGTQSFDFDINYGINLRLKDILTKKKDTEDGYIVDDGSGARLFLLMTGTIDKPVFKLDKEGRKNYKEEQRAQEKGNVKGILKDEFGLFKNDSSAKKSPEKPKAKPKFEVEWEENKSTPTTPKKSESQEETEERAKKRKTWLDKLKGEEEKKKKVGFEVE
ncbi:MAG: AsmA-like C-terminal region-containing protein [Flavobacteriales bacterium]